MQAIAAGVALAGTVSATVAFAQDPGGPPPPGPGGPPPGPGGLPRPGGPGFGRGPGQGSLANLPIDALAAALNLTNDQKTKIADIQKQLRQQRQNLMPRPGDQLAGPPDPDTMRANMDKLRSLEQGADRNIRAALTADQRQSLPAVLRDLGNLREVGIPAELYGTLNLTASQKQVIAAIVRRAQTQMRQKLDAARQSGDFGAARDAMMQSRKQTHDDALAALTDAQRGAIEKFIEEHPRPQGPNGFGPPPNGFGPPPPGEFGPPPGDGPPPPDGPGGPDVG
jgi:Spy/CpxP family protein refolding chaperone